MVTAGVLGSVGGEDGMDGEDTEDIAGPLEEGLLERTGVTFSGTWTNKKAAG
jgi:hypothetical protein